MFELMLRNTASSIKRCGYRGQNATANNDAADGHHGNRWSGTYVRLHHENNLSGRGTFYWDAEGSEETDMFRFIEVKFSENDTVTDLYGGVAWVDHASAAGGQPQIAFSDCTFSSNNDLDFPNPTDPEDSYLETEADYAIHTPYFPEYRIGEINGGNGYTSAEASTPADINSDAPSTALTSMPSTSSSACAGRILTTLVKSTLATC